MRALALAMAVSVASFACSDPGGSGGDGGHDVLTDGASGTTEADVDEAAADADSDGSDSADAAAVPGPATFVVAERAFVAERLFDHDGDGLPDNAVADLGSTEGALMAAAWSALLQEGVEGGMRSLVHFPWIDDLSGPADPGTVLILVQGEDTDDPPEPADDFSGSEPFYAQGSDIDGCGEPLKWMEGLAIGVGPEGPGFLDGHFGPYFLDLCKDTEIDELCGATLRDARVQGQLEPRAEGGELVIGGYFTALELGALHSDFGGEGLSWLESVVAGGAAVGYPLFPGLSPNIDVDGDGLERFEVGEDFTLTRCIDGDATPIEGRNCWLDPRIADAFALVTSMGLVPATFEGLEPGWQSDPRNPGSCEDPPESSLWDPR